MDLVSSIANMSMEMSQARVTEGASMKMMKNNLDNAEVAAAKMMEMIDQPAVSASAVGGLLDVTV